MIITERHSFPNLPKNGLPYKLNYDKTFDTDDLVMWKSGSKLDNLT